MSKHKGNYGSSKATLAPASTSSVGADSSTLLSTASSFEILVDVLESYGFDLTAMLLIFWCLVAFIVVIGINLYLTLVKRQQRIQNEQTNRNQKEAQSLESSISASSVNSLKDAPKKNHLDSDEDSRAWIQKVIEWLYRADTSSPTIITECIDAWLASLNSKSRKLTVEVSGFSFLLYSIATIHLYTNTCFTNCCCVRKFVNSSVTNVHDQPN